MHSLSQGVINSDKVLIFITLNMHLENRNRVQECYDAMQNDGKI